MKEPGKYDKKVSAFIDSFWKRYYRSPTIQEICTGVGISSKSTASYVVRKIAKNRGDVVFDNQRQGVIIPRWVVSAIAGMGK